jgi:heme-degrading monooxygenase HmoA
MHVIVWQYEVAAGMEGEFVQAYGRDGVWAKFFAKGDGYQETELMRKSDEPDQYATVDRWQSREHYQRFRDAHAAEYHTIDEQCERLTLREHYIGNYDSL